jgi:hypothetical protein
MYQTAPATHPYFLASLLFTMILNAFWFVLIANKYLTSSAVVAVVLAMTTRMSLVYIYAQ